jgi:hypothetical protein
MPHTSNIYDYRIFYFNDELFASIFRSIKECLVEDYFLCIQKTSLLAGIFINIGGGCASYKGKILYLVEAGVTLSNRQSIFLKKEARWSM